MGKAKRKTLQSRWIEAFRVYKKKKPE